MELVLIIVLIAAVLIAGWVMGVYNTLVKFRNMVKNQWSQIDVLLKRRSDLIPTLVETVKGYAAHESETLEAVVNARNKTVAAPTEDARVEAEGELTQVLSRLMVLTENYPDLKANENFMELQKELSETEDKIAYARQFYNDAVLKFNNKIEMFPSNLVANMFNFKAKTFFQIEEAAKAMPEVKF